MITRRMLLVTGGASILVVGGLGTGLSMRADLGKARQPWKDAAKGFGDARLDALAYAILAPNPHNRQPWRVRLDGDDALTLFVDTNALLPATDPFNRQIVVGLGAFLELLRQAAVSRGYRADIAAFPDGAPQPVLDRRPIAHVRLVADAAVKPDPLFGAALDRRTARVPFDTGRGPGAAVISALGGTLRHGADGVQFGSTREPQFVASLKMLCKAGWAVEAAGPETLAESARLTRIGAAEINAQPDGISLGGPMMEALGMSGLLTREAMTDPASFAHGETLDFYNGLIDSAAAFGWLTTPANTRADQIRAGADWVRINLAATRSGIAMHPLSQVLQEFPEMRALYNETHARLGVDPPAVIQGLFRFGYAAAPPPSPRWPLESRLLPAS